MTPNFSPTPSDDRSAPATQQERPPLTVPVDLLALPALTGRIFAALRTAGLEHFALFGGAVRDADFNARNEAPRTIKDYDLRIWLPEAAFTNDVTESLARLTREFPGGYQTVPAGGTPHMRYLFSCGGMELDLSFRRIPAEYAETSLSPSSVARDRAGDSDVGLCAVAIDPEFQCWCRREYLADQANRTLTVYPISDPTRKEIYLTRMRAKFPGHTVVDLGL